MGETTNISWTNATFNPWWGCQRVSPACGQGGLGGCYAEAFAKRVGHGNRLPDIWGPKAERRFFGDKHWNEPVKWDRAAEKAGVRRRVFCASMADVFERVSRPEIAERLDEARERLWNLIEATPWLDWQLLTKRPENFSSMLPARWRAPGAMPRHLWLGVTVESAEYIWRVQHLLRTCAAITFVSAEPLLEDISAAIAPYLGMRPLETTDGRWVSGYDKAVRTLGGTRWPALDQVIVGGESGPNSRPFYIEWVRALIRECSRAGTAVFVKQMGDHTRWDGMSNPGQHWPSSTVTEDDGRGGFRVRLKIHHGADPIEWPKDLRVQQFPRRTV